MFNAVGDGAGATCTGSIWQRCRVTRIAATPDYEVAPDTSPDGKSVVFAAGKPGDRADHIFLRSLDGRMVNQLTGRTRTTRPPPFSPDGSLIVFTRDKTYNWGGLASNWDAGGAALRDERRRDGPASDHDRRHFGDRPPFLSRQQDDSVLEQ